MNWNSSFGVNITSHFEKVLISRFYFMQIHKYIFHKIKFPFRSESMSPPLIASTFQTQGIQSYIPALPLSYRGMEFYWTPRKDLNLRQVLVVTLQVPLPLGSRLVYWVRTLTTVVGGFSFILSISLSLSRPDGLPNC